jgi:cholest-4-en-3-one 26-monooxygenase
MTGRLDENIIEICGSLLDDAARQGGADFVAEVAAPLPGQVICELVGAPPEGSGRIFELSNRVVGIDGPEFGGSPAGQQ